ncbi:hypothetical protein R5R35_010199 [Gryllus longicercus]|uniref:Endoglucanase n=1 Tax=Gryllus longicercus TaxID=2509291 RepID=A0AAN9VPT1_9ORTH
MQLIRCALVLVGVCAFVQGGNYDYADLIRKSLLFYQAQRSGRLSGMDPLVSWRKDSALNDRGNNGEDLTGGYYDAGDFVKFGFPMAYTITMLSWGVIDYENTYSSIGALNEARAAIKWGTDYFIKAHVSANELYGQVGNGGADHSWWGRPEDMTMDRPAYKIDTGRPGSDLAAETAAAMAAASIVFRNADSNYANTLLQHARELYNFADSYRGKYSDSINDAAAFYNSYSYEDELVWGAIWLWRATNDQNYLNKATQYYNQYGIQYKTSPLSWDDKSTGASALLAKLTGGDQYKSAVQSFCDGFYYNQQKTPKGLIWYSDWGSLRQSLNAVWVCLQAADAGVKSGEYRSLGKIQLDYALGDAGRSYVVGFGNNPPSHEQHRAASCPDAPAACDWNTYNGGQSNYHVLYGALVGGPDANDYYNDVRNDYVHNEVACDYNAGFQNVLASLKANGY